MDGLVTNSSTNLPLKFIKFSNVKINSPLVPSKIKSMLIVSDSMKVECVLYDITRYIKFIFLKKLKF